MILSILVAALVVLADTLTKYAVKTSMTVGMSHGGVPGLFRITYVLNKGAAWGIFADRRWIFLVFSCVAIVLVTAALVRLRKAPVLLRLSLSLILGGGIGNMIDRVFNGTKLFDGAVVDFIDLAFMDFPVFNVADCAVTVGTVLLIVYLLFFESKPSKNETTVGGEEHDG